MDPEVQSQLTQLDNRINGLVGDPKIDRSELTDIHNRRKSISDTINQLKAENDRVFLSYKSKLSSLIRSLNDTIDRDDQN